MIPRTITEKILGYLEGKEVHKDVLIVDGLRQVGKTTAIKMGLERFGGDFLEINLEKSKLVCKQIDESVDFSDFEKLLFREFHFKPGEGKILFIDEANESERLGHYVRQMKEDWKNQTTILSGSMIHRLFRDKKLRIPVGRFESLTVQPFHFSEFLMANEMTDSPLKKYGLYDLIQNPESIIKMGDRDHELLLKLMDHYFTCGGVPKITLSYLKTLDKKALQKNISFYLENLKDDFLKMFSEEYTNLFDRAINSVANILGYPYKKTAMIQNNDRLANNILSILEKWKLIYKIEQKSQNPAASNSFFPKRYLFDVGVAKQRRELGIPSIDLIQTLQAKQREPLGGLIEQYVCLEFIRQGYEICGFKDRSYEIDFMIKGEEMVPVECKAALKVNKKHFRGLDLYNQFYHNQKAVLLTLAPYQKIKRDHYEIVYLPLYALDCYEKLI